MLKNNEKTLVELAREAEEMIEKERIKPIIINPSCKYYLPCGYCELKKEYCSNLRGV